MEEILIFFFSFLRRKLREGRGKGVDEEKEVLFLFLTLFFISDLLKVSKTSITLWEMKCVNQFSLNLD